MKWQPQKNLVRKRCNKNIKPPKSHFGSYDNNVVRICIRYVRPKQKFWRKLLSMNNNIYLYFIERHLLLKMIFDLVLRTALAPLHTFNINSIFFSCEIFLVAKFLKVKSNGSLQISKWSTLDPVIYGCVQINETWRLSKKNIFEFSCTIM